MELPDARKAKQEIFASLGLTYVRTRAGEPRFSVGIATAQSPRGFRVAVRARSNENLEAARSQGRLSVLERYPESEIDLRITGPVVARTAEPATTPRRLSIGASIGHYLCTAGTLGFFARRTSDGALGVVSNNHVLANGDEGDDGDDILHPAPADHGLQPADVVGHLAGGYPRLDDETPVVDCAFAKLRDGVEFDPATITPGLLLKKDPARLEGEPIVLKKGRTTGLTRGRITAIDFDHCDVEYDFGIVVFDRQIEIESIGEGPFSRPGDSGSLIIDPDGHPVGLLAANTLDCRLHYANPIEEVLSALGVTVWV